MRAESSKRPQSIVLTARASAWSESQLLFQLSCFLRQMKKLRLVRHAKAYSTALYGGRANLEAPRHEDHSKPRRAYLAIEAWAVAIFALTASGFEHRAC